MHSDIRFHNVGNPEEITIAELARKVTRLCGREAEVAGGPPTPGATLRRCPDISKARALGYAPRVALDEGLPRVVDWYRERAAERAAADRPAPMPAASAA